MPSWEVNINEACVTCLADFISHVIDNKSIFTRKHTSQIANRAWLMATHYGYTKEEKDALYLAASLHDIGKMATPIGILEKPGKLSKDEFKIIKTHVKSTYDWLSEIPGFGLMRDWAAFHHEKLDGSGYPFGKKGIELDFNARLIACLDIYQAAGEKRPYHDARSHEETMLILYEMAGNSSIDSNIVKDIDTIMKQFSMKDAPAPKSIENA